MGFQGMTATVRKMPLRSDDSLVRRTAPPRVPDSEYLALCTHVHHDRQAGITASASISIFSFATARTKAGHPDVFAAQPLPHKQFLSLVGDRARRPPVAQRKNERPCFCRQTLPRSHGHGQTETPDHWTTEDAAGPFLPESSGTPKSRAF